MWQQKTNTRTQPGADDIDKKKMNNAAKTQNKH